MITMDGHVKCDECGRFFQWREPGSAWLFVPDTPFHLRGITGCVRPLCRQARSPSPAADRPRGHVLRRAAMTRPRSPTDGIIENVRASRRESLAAPERVTRKRTTVTQKDMLAVRRMAGEMRSRAEVATMVGAQTAACGYAGDAEVLERVVGVLEVMVREEAA